MISARLGVDTNFLESVREWCDQASLGLVSIQWVADFPCSASATTVVGEMSGRLFEAVFSRPLSQSERILLQHLCQERDALYRQQWALLEMVHELGNPLSVLDGHLQFIHAGLQSEERWRAVFRSIAQMSRQLHQAKDNDPVRPFNVLEVIDDIIADLSTLAQTKRVTYKRPDQPLVLTCSRGRTQQILFNLLKNAVEAAQPQGVIDIAVAYENDECRISVKNRGQCIPADIADILFLPGRSSKSPDHLGMGLAVSRTLAQELGAQLTYTDELGFTLRVPLGAQISPRPALLQEGSCGHQNTAVFH